MFPRHHTNTHEAVVDGNNVPITMGRVPHTVSVQYATFMCWHLQPTLLSSRFLSGPNAAAL